jgi:sugar phosphate isomerase/epimerase
MKQQPPFSVSEFTTWDLSFEQDVALYRSLNLSGIEVCERKLSTDVGQAREQLALLRDSGLQVTSVQPRVHALFKDAMCPHLLDPEERLRCYRQTIDLFAQSLPGQDIPLVTIGGNAPAYNFRLAHATARRLYPDLARYAADRGLRVMFEPLHPILMNADTFISSLDEALHLIEDVDEPAFGLMLDLWHVWHEHAIGSRVRALGKLIFGVHISDWPRQQPRGLADRILPGQGLIDLPGLLGAVAAAGYQGAYCLEIFSAHEWPDSLWRADPTRIIEEGRRGFYKAWESTTCD